MAPQPAEKGVLRYPQNDFAFMKPALDKSSRVAKSPASIYGVLASSQTPDVQEASQSELVTATTGADNDLIYDLAIHIHGGLRNCKLYERRKLASTAKSGDGQPTDSHLDEDHPPIADHDAIFEDIVKNLLANGFAKIVESLKGRSLRLFTMCSGTEAPVIAIRKIKAALERQIDHNLNINHIASCEIQPFKQAYIRRNFGVNLIFRDVTEFWKENLAKKQQPLTAYGAPHDPPHSIDILIAGSSCVDYSNMNRSPKKFKIDGESWATMRGVADYARKFQPIMVILENVKDAPWKDIKRYWEEEVGYVSHVIYADTKDFYLPQTRQRGYMVCINIDFAETHHFPWETQLPKFESNILALARRATVPYSSFTVSPDDPRFQAMARDIFNPRNSHSRHVDWVSSHFRMNNYRRELKLGFSRAVTHWQPNGSSNPPDYFSNRTWTKLQVLRILDSLDIALLRDLVKKGWNPFYKARFLDLSQNIDREQDSKQPGIAGCITPDGIFFDTLRGGPLSGRELLALQGLPDDELNFTVETSRQLTNLAGNAMSTTVVGSVIAAALSIAAWGDDKEKSLFTCRDEVVDKSEQQERPLILPVPHQPMEAVVQEWATHHQLEPRMQLLNGDPLQDMDVMISSASRSRQLCSCEGYAESKEATFYICTDCSHTACQDCKANPQHKYEEFNATDRALPSDFVSYIQCSLPRALKLDSQAFTQICGQLKPFTDAYVKEHCEIPEDSSPSEPEDSRPAKKRRANGKKPAIKVTKPKPAIIEDPNPKYRDWAYKAVDATYHYRNTYRSRVWRIEYTSPVGRLELRISPKSDILDMCRPDILRPLGVECEWLLFANCDPKEGAGTNLREVLQNPIAFMTPDQGILQGTWKAWKPQSLVTKIALNGLGTQQDSWEKQLGVQDETFKHRMEFPKLVMTSEIDELLPTTTFELLPECAGAQGSLHRGLDRHKRPIYFFLDPNPLSLADEDSYVLAYDHHRRNNYERRRIILRLQPGWRPKLANGQLVDNKVDCEYLADWEELPGMTMEAETAQCSAALWVADATINTIQVDLSSCAGIEAPVIGIKVPLSAAYALNFEPGQTFKFSIADRRGRFDMMEWLLKRTVLPPQLPTHWTPLGTLPVGEGHCKCCPKTPDITWQWVWATGRCNSKVIKPFENEDEAVAFEKASQSRPSPASVIAHCYEGEVLLEVLINPQTLAHRAAAAVCPSLISSTSASMAWRMLKYNALEVLPSFKHKELEDNSDDVEWPQPIANPKHLPTNFRRDLRKAQRRLLSWNLKQESSPPFWEEEEQTDATVPPLDWSMELRARLERNVRGGVIADEVGAGKTTSALALFAADKEMIANSQQSVRVHPTKRRIRSDATLVVVPANIITQWENQIKDCFSTPDEEYITLRNMEAIRQHTIEDLITAKVILVPRKLLDDLDYWNDLRKLTYSPNVPMSGGRAFKQWLDLSLDALGGILSKYADGGLWEEREKCKDRLAQYETFTAFRTHREHKKKYEANAAPKAPDNANMGRSAQYNPRPSERTDSKLDDDYKTEMEDYDEDLHPLLHLFHFRRLIIDEFQYLEALSLHGAIALSAENRWLLSATPPTTTVDGINAMASLIGTKVQNKPLLPEDLGGTFKSSPTVHSKSHAEEFLRYASPVSVSALGARHAHANDFLGKFVRKNPFVPRGINKEEHYIIFKPSALDYATHVEFYKAVRNSKLNYGTISHPTEKSKFTRSVTVKKWAEHAVDASSALISSTSMMRQQNASSDGPEAACSAVLEAQRTRCEEIVTEIYTNFRQAFGYDKFVKVKTKLKPKAKPKSKGKGKGKAEASAEAQVVPEAAPVPLENSERLTDFVHSVTDGESFDDVRVSQFLNRLLNLASEDPESPAKPPSSDTAEEKITALTTKLTKSILELMKMVKDLRFFDVVNKIVYPTDADPFDSAKDQAHSESESSKRAQCASCSIGVTENPHSMVLLTSCGHVLCNACNENLPDDECPDLSCSALTPPDLRIPGSCFGNSKTVAHTEHGSRMDAVAKKVSEALAESDEERVLVFVQFDQMRDHLIAALKDNDIPAVDATQDGPKGGPKGKQVKKPVAEKVMKFIEDADKNVKKCPRVLLFKINTEDAAGWNLHKVNHVLFVAPFHAKTKHTYDSVMHQAIGRALRFGNKSPVVNVYFFAMAHTCEVNILEERLGQVVVEREGKIKLLANEDLVQEGDVRLRGEKVGAQEASGDEGDDDDGEGAEEGEDGEGSG